MIQKHAVYKGGLTLGRLTIPVSIYKTVDLFGLEGHRYHEGCGGKIREKMFCEIHPDEEEVVTFTGIEIGDRVVAIGSEVRNSLLDRKALFIVKSIHKLSELPDLLVSNTVVPICMYEVAPQQVGSPVAQIHHNALFTLLDRLKVKKSFLLCNVALAGMYRPAILLHSGQLYPLLYREEVRDFAEWNGEVDKELTKFLNSTFGKMTNGFPRLSLVTYRKKVEAWFTMHLKGQRILPADDDEKPVRKKGGRKTKVSA